MDIDLLFDPIFLIGLTFFGIVVPIFALSVSFLGHGLEKAKEKTIKHREEAEKELEKEFKELENRLNEFKNSPGEKKDIFVASQKVEGDLNKLKKSRKNFERESTKIITRYDLLKFKECVLTTGLAFSFTIIFSLTAKTSNNPKSAFISLLFSLLLLLLGIYRICKCLSVIQEVALSSDKYQQERMYDAIYKAFEAHAESEKPELKITFKNLDEPFKFPKATEITLDFTIELTEGRIAKNTKILFLVPKDFDFPSRKNKWNQAANYTLPNALSTEYVVDDVRRGINSSGSITIKTPPNLGDYKICYCLSSEEFFERKFIDVQII